jgi:hypothetical protein
MGAGGLVGLLSGDALKIPKDEFHTHKLQAVLTTNIIPVEVGEELLCEQQDKY